MTDRHLIAAALEAAAALPQGQVRDRLERAIRQAEVGGPSPTLDAAERRRLYLAGLTRGLKLIPEIDQEIDR